MRTGTSYYDDLKEIQEEKHQRELIHARQIAAEFGRKHDLELQTQLDRIEAKLDQILAKI